MNEQPPAFPREKVLELCEIAGIPVNSVTGIKIDAASILFEMPWQSIRFPLSVNEQQEQPSVEVEDSAE